jgi:hypothetical protein
MKSSGMKTVLTVAAIAVVTLIIVQKVPQLRNLVYGGTTTRPPANQS